MKRLKRLNHILFNQTFNNNKKAHIYHDQLLKGGKYVKKSKTKGNLYLNLKRIRTIIDSIEKHFTYKKNYKKNTEANTQKMRRNKNRTLITYHLNGHFLDHVPAMKMSLLARLCVIMVHRIGILGNHLLGHSSNL